MAVVVFGHGATVTYGGFTAQITGVSGPSLARDAIDITHMGSPNKWREFMPGLIDAGELTLEVHFDPTEAPAIAAAYDPATPTPLTITWPDSANTQFVAEGAFMTGYDVGDPVDDKMTASVTFKLSGEMNFSGP